MASLLGQNIGTNYKGIITIGSTINQNISASLQSLTDGDGNLLPIQVSTTKAAINGNLSFIKTDGTGYIQSAWQSASPAGVASNTTLWFDSTGRINWRLGTGFIRTFDATGITADRVYVLPNATTTLAGLSLAQTFTVTQSIIPTTTTSSGLIIQTGTTTSHNILSVYNAAGTAGWQSRAGDMRITFTGYDYGIESVSSNGTIYLIPGSNGGAVRIPQSRGLIVGVDALPSARLHIRGDGTNSIARFETNAGVGGLVINTNGTPIIGDAYIGFNGVATQLIGIEPGGFLYYHNANRFQVSTTGIVTTYSKVNLTASTTSNASMNIPSGTAPTTPNNGDIWFDGTDIKIRVAGVTKTFTLI